MADVEVGLPKGLKIDYFDEYIHIQKKWFGWTAVFLTVFAAIWMGVGGYFLFTIGHEFYVFGAWVEYVMPLVFGIACVSFMYTIAAFWLNVTHIYVSKNLMEVKITPVRWLGEFKMETAQFKQLYVVEHVRHNHKSNTTTITYEVRIMLHSGGEKKLIAGLGENMANVIERKIEDYLGIKDEQIN